MGTCVSPIKAGLPPVSARQMVTTSTEGVWLLQIIFSSDPAWQWADTEGRCGGQGLLGGAQDGADTLTSNELGQREIERLTPLWLCRVFGDGAGRTQAW